MAGTLTIQSTVLTGVTQSNGLSSTKFIGPLQIQSTSPILQILDVPFGGAGFVTITPPFGATAVVIVPPSGNLIGITLKGVTGDTGIPLATNQVSVISLSVPSGASPVFGITAAGAIIGNIEFNFF